MSQINKDDLIWGCCSVGLEDKNYLECTKCKKVYHEVCLSMPSDREEPNTTKWVCPFCIDAQKLRNSDNTPVRYNPNKGERSSKRQALNSPPTTSEKPVTQDEMREIIQNAMLEMNKSVGGTIRDILGLELKSLKDEIKEMKEAMSFINSKYETITKEHDESVKKMRYLESENKEMQSKIDNMSNRINQMEQNARVNNIEIQCVPERKEENLLKIVSELGKSINCHITEEQLTHYTRVAKLNKDSDRPRSIVVQFSASKMRDQFLASAIKHNKFKPHDRLNSSHAGISGTKTPIYISEHLSPANKALHAAARQTAKEKGYKYVWIRNGRVYMRKTDNSEFKIIRDVDTLQKLP